MSRKDLAHAPFDEVLAHAIACLHDYRDDAILAVVLLLRLAAHGEPVCFKSYLVELRIFVIESLAPFLNRLEAINLVDEVMVDSRFQYHGRKVFEIGDHDLCAEAIRFAFARLAELEAASAPRAEHAQAVHPDADRVPDVVGERPPRKGDP